jgi:TetR/AcrR family fatty acid metabolism transcriptional regulator
MSPPPELTEERRSQILDAALAVFGRLGFHKARMDDVANEAGLSKGALYLYFTEGKDAIIAGILRMLFERELKRLTALQLGEGSVGEQLLAYMRRMAGEFEGMSALLSISFEFYALAARHKGVRKALKVYFQQYRAALIVLIQHGIDRGEFRQVNPDEVAIALTGLCEGVALLWMVDPQAVRLRQSFEASVHLLLDGLKARE